MIKAKCVASIAARELEVSQAVLLLRMKWYGIEPKYNQDGELVPVKGIPAPPKPRVLKEELIAFLKEHQWDVKKAAARFDVTGATIRVKMKEYDLLPEEADKEPEPKTEAVAEKKLGFRGRREDVGEEEVIRALEQANGVKSRAARLLKVSHPTICQRMREYGITIEFENGKVQIKQEEWDEQEIADTQETDEERKMVEELVALKPEQISSSEEIEEEMIALARNKTRAPKLTRQERSLIRYDDVVKNYLREAGRAKLLTWDQEVYLSKRIRGAKLEILEALFSSPQVISELERLAQEIKAGEVSVTKVVGAYPSVSQVASLMRIEARDQLLKQVEFLSSLAGQLRQGHWQENKGLVKERAEFWLGEFPPRDSTIKRLKTKLVESDQEHDQYLVKKMRRAERDLEQARAFFTISNLRLVISIAKRYINRGLGFSDLIQEGNSGLMRGVDKFDWRRGYKFSTYATWWIRQAITRAIADQSRTIRVPVHSVETMNKVIKTSRKLTQKLGREPKAEEVAKEAGVSLGKVLESFRHISQPISLDRPVGEKEDSLIGDFLEDKKAASPDNDANLEIVREHLETVLSTLTTREQKVIKLRFGLEDGHRRTLEQVGSIFNVTRERVRQIEFKALRKLKHPTRKRKLEGSLELLKKQPEGGFENS